MKPVAVLLLLVCTAASAVVAGKQSSEFLYVSPVPGSAMVSGATNIIVRRADAIGRESVRDLEGIVITGSASGAHNARCVIADDGKTAVWTPATPFSPGETVTVLLPRTFHGRASVTGPSFSWTFTVSAMNGAFPPSFSTEGWSGVPAAGVSAVPLRPFSRPDSVPSDFPVIKVDSVNNPSAGSIFLTTTNTLAGLGFYNMVLDNTGNPVSYLKANPYSCDDFKVQPNGLLSYARVTGVAGAGISPTVEMVLDSSLAVVDSFQCGNGYTADVHEFILLPNGHAILMAYDPEPVDMSKIVPGGNPNAVVLGSIIQEEDAAKNVVFQWRSWDYVPITDCYDILTASAFDYIHVNSIDVDTDGNLIVSCRETASVLKIDHLTGDVIWIWGGKRNQFTFIGDNASNAPNYFSYQHHVRRIANGDITMMDNGNQHVPPYSRAAEYALDENAKTATLVWEFRHTPDVYTPATGSVQRLPNGNTLIGWGSANFLGFGDIALSEVRPDKSTALEMSMPKGLFSYRAFRFPWKTELPSGSVSLLDLHPGVDYSFNTTGQNTGVSINLSIGSAMYSRVTVTRYPYAPLAPALGANPPTLAPLRAVIAQAGFVSYTGTVTFDSTFTSLFPSPAATTVYSRPTEGSGAFTPMATTYDAGKHTLTVTTSQFGEYAFGWNAGSAGTVAPALISPPDGGFVNENNPVGISWSARGRALRYYVQVATDSAFAHLALSDTTGTPSVTLAGPVHDTVYYWRAESIGDSGVSAWSPRWRFITHAPFIGFTYPAGGETFMADSSYIIRWQTNQSGAVRLLLLKGGGDVLTISDSTQNTGAYVWKVPLAIASSGGYTLSLRSRVDTTIAAVSAGSFSITGGTLSISPGSGTPHSYALDQNYPNPFNPSTMIRYALPGRASVVLEVFNTLGQQVATLVSETEEPGIHEVRFDASGLASGMYFYRLSAHTAIAGVSAGAPAAGTGDYVQTRKLLLVR